MILHTIVTLLLVAGSLYKITSSLKFSLVSVVGGLGTPWDPELAESLRWNRVNSEETRSRVPWPEYLSVAAEILQSAYL